MKALFATGYGKSNVLCIKDVPTPEPGENEVLIQIQRAALSKADTMMREGTPKFARLFLGLRAPKHPIPGTGFAGRVIALGANSSRFKVNDWVYGESTLTFGAHAQYLCLNENELIRHMPQGLSPEEAAPMCDGPLTAYNFLTQVSQLSPGQSILINGASGSIGNAAIQIAKSLGANVTAMCRQVNHDWVTALGADTTLDYQTHDLQNQTRKFDVIFDTVGQLPFRQCQSHLSKNGVYLTPVLSSGVLIRMLFNPLHQKKVLFSATGLCPVSQLDQWLSELEDLIRKHKLSVMIDRQYPLEEFHAAHSYLDSNRKKGSVVLQF